jgi:GT2 family glycosyltransferase
VSVIVLAWPPNQAADRNVLTLLDMMPGPPRDMTMEVVVVCNGQDPALVERLKAHPSVQAVLAPGQNLGVARGWNIGAAAATGDVLVFVNEDVIMGSSTLDGLVANLSAYDVGISGVESSIWDSVRMQQVARGRELSPGETHPLFAVAAGYLFAVPASVWTAIGGVDNELEPASFEDIDLGIRVARAGYRVVTRPNENVHHAWGISRAGRRRRIHWVEGTVRLGASHRRNHQRMIRKWSPDAWRAHPAVHGLVYYSIHWRRRLFSATREIRSRARRFAALVARGNT